MDGIAGKVIAVTGASSGIGEAIATVLAREGARVVIGARRLDQLNKLAARLRRDGGDVTVQQTDVTKAEDVKRLVDTAVERYARLDVLVSNAGIAPVSAFDAVQIADWDRMIDVNVRGLLHGIAAALPLFRRQDTGHFVNIVSTAGLKLAPGQGVYAATKNAARTITEALRLEAGPKLRVTGVSPGFVRTNLPDSMAEGDDRAQIAGMMEEIAIDPACVANAVAFAIAQPADVEIGDLVIRPTAQG